MTLCSYNNMAYIGTSSCRATNILLLTRDCIVPANTLIIQLSFLLAECAALLVGCGVKDIGDVIASDAQHIDNEPIKYYF